MILVEDTRNQIGKHKILNNEFNKLGIAVLRNKLYVGDYSRLDNMTISVDTKKDWVELAGNICGKQHTRFREECLRAKSAQIKLIVLVEEEVSIEEWESPRKRSGELICHVSNDVLKKAMTTMTEKYGVDFIHCAKEQTAQTILKIFGG